MDRHCVTRSRKWAWALVLGLAACNNAEKLPTSSFSGPAGLAVAGPGYGRVFVANSGFDAVQVVTLDAQLPNIDMAMAPARFFPLFIPAGPNPTDLAATGDGAYVFVLDTLLGAVRVIDANALTLVPLTGALDGFGVSLAPLDSTFDAMVGSPSACSAAGVPGGRCAGRIYLASQALGQVAIADAVLAADGSMSLLGRGWVPAGGTPGRMAVTAIEGGDRLFVTDLDTQVVNQIDITGNVFGVVAQANLGERGGALGVSANGNYLVVARPAFQDVLVYELTPAGLGANPTPVDLTPVFTPAPRFFNSCSAPVTAFQNVHPADLELCSDGNTWALATPANPYPGAYLGAIPTRIAPVASAATPVQVSCATLDAPSSYQEVLAVATVDGGIYFLALVDDTGAFKPRLLTQDNCAAPTLSVAPQGTPPASYLAPCSASTAVRSRTQCVADGSNAADGTVAPGVVTLAPGNARLTPSLLAPGSVGIRLDWEGVIYDGSNGAGSVSAANAKVFSEPGINFTGTVGPNDVLRLAANTVPLELSDACQAALIAADVTDNCLVERRIMAVSADGTQLTLNEALPRACFADPDAVPYVIRAGGAFLAGSVVNGMWQQLPPARVAPGQSFGMGSAQNNGVGYLSFTVQQLPRDANATDPNGRVCALYGDDGKVNSTTQSQFLQRNQPLDFYVNDPYTPALWGRALDTTTTISTAAGQVPAGMVMAPAPYSVLLVSYSGSNGVYAMRPGAPTNPALINNIGYVRILN